MFRSEFIRSISDVELTDIMVNYFTEVMALYNLFGEDNEFDVIKGNIDNGSITFYITFNSESNVEEIVNYINGKKFTFYNTYCTIDAIQNKNTITLRLI